MSGKDGRKSYTFADGVNQPLTYQSLGPKVWVLGGLMVVTAIVTLVLILQDFSSNSYLYLMFYAIPANSARPRSPRSQPRARPRAERRPRRPSRAISSGWRGSDRGPMASSSSASKPATRRRSGGA